MTLEEALAKIGSLESDAKAANEKISALDREKKEALDKAEKAESDAKHFEDEAKRAFEARDILRDEAKAAKKAADDAKKDARKSIEGEYSEREKAMKTKEDEAEQKKNALQADFDVRQKALKAGVDPDKLDLFMRNYSTFADEKTDEGKPKHADPIAAVLEELPTLAINQGGGLKGMPGKNKPHDGLPMTADGQVDRRELARRGAESLNKAIAMASGGAKENDK